MSEKNSLAPRCHNCSFWQRETVRSGVCKSPTERRIVMKHGGAFPTAFAYGLCDEYEIKKAAS